jgi:hypothetical protein
MRFGVVLFDDAVRKAASTKRREATEGWASIDGAASRRIASVNELESDVRWLTNFEFADFHQNFLGRNPNYFFSGFLRTELKMICEEIGGGIEYISANKSAEVLSGMFSRVMNLCVSTLNIKVNVSGTATKVLPDLIAARTVNKHKIPDELNEALRHAYQTYTGCVQRFNREWKSCTIRKPRYSHAIDVLSTPVPGEYRWLYIHGARLPADNSARIDWCLAHDLPVLANVIVKPRRNNYASIIAYANGSQFERSWLCQPELLLISQFCDVEVIGVFVCEAGFEVQKELEAFPTLGDMSLASYSLGLVAESFWVAMASPRATSATQKFFPPRAIWYRAMDRIAMFQEAVKFQKEGFQVFGYGAGAVTVYYPAGSTADLVQAGAKFGLDVPVGKYYEVRTEARLQADE